MMARTRKASFSLDAATVKNCEDAVNITFQSLFGIETRLLEVSPNASPQHPNEIIGVIGFVQDGVQVVLTIGFRKETLLPIFGEFYGEAFDHLHERVIDGMGEITNIIFGVMKEKYNTSGYNFEMCLPTVVVGRNSPLFSKMSEQNVLLLFEGKTGKFNVELLAMAKGKDE